jgi:predicted MPP superfamily phosphohydrolase
MRSSAGTLLFICIVLGILGSGNFYILKRFFAFFDLKSGLIFWALLLALSSSLIVAMILDSTFQNFFTWILHYIAALWFGIWFLLICALAVHDLVRIFITIPGKTSAIAVISIVSLVSLYGFWNAKQLKTTELEFPAKIDADLVHLSDVHFGSPNGMQFEKVVERISEIEPDAVLITGDLVEPTSRLDEPGIKLLNELDYPVFLTLGNHELYTGDQKLKQLLGKTKIKVLRNQTAFLNGIELVGLDDSENPRQVERSLERLDIDEEKFNILMYHRPDGFEAAVESGIDLMLSGHTHNGQIWPFKWLVKLRFPRISGQYEIDRHWLYVTTGTGNWGPPLRIGSQCELVHIKLRSPH